jgi:hypothetical protein
MMDMSEFTVVAGLHQRSKPHPDRTQRRKVARIFNHERYDEASSENDIAIVRLAAPIKPSSYANAVCLPGKDPALHETVTIGTCPSHAKLASVCLSH